MNNNDRHIALIQGVFSENEKNYEIDDSFRPSNPPSFKNAHTVSEVAELLESDKSIEFEGKFLVSDGENIAKKHLNKSQFLERWKHNNDGRRRKKIQESFDWFDSGGFPGSNFGGNTIGNDYTPLLGGPFHKQLYLYDMLRMISLSFFAFHHDPFARATVNIIRNFTLGTGYRIDSKNKAALALWRAFESVNNLPMFMRNSVQELSLYGENMIWWLPNGQTAQEWKPRPGQEVPRALIPRIRLIDPSTCWEVITMPEAIDRVIAYQLVYPTQYQLYSADKGGEKVPMSKFIFDQVPGDQVQHFKINCMSNEKRGRSDLYPAFGYMKRLRDSVSYSMAALLKNAAWAIDTTVEGSPADLQNYVNAQNSMPSIPPAGSEFVHTAKIKREYMASAGAGSHSSNSFEWCLTMACMTVGIPMSYYGTHFSGGQTRASAIVGTEPVAKNFQDRQMFYEFQMRSMWNKLMLMFGMNEAVDECEITFPELITQDRSAKIKDLIMSYEVGAFSHEYLCTTIAKEMGNSSYDYKAEQEAIQKEKAIKQPYDDLLISPLTAKPVVPSKPEGGGDSEQSSSLTQEDRKSISDSGGY